MRRPSLVLALAAGCALSHGTDHTDAPSFERTSGIVPEVDATGPALASAVAADVTLAAFEDAPDVAPRKPAKPLPDDVAQRIDGYFQGHGTRRLHVQLDRPMYRPGESVWVKTWAVRTRGLERDGTSASITYELLDPRGQVVETKMVQQDRGAAANDFVLDGGAPGGKWTLRATLPTGEVDERPFVVSAYSAPRIRKDLEFVREAYGAGDTVEALVEMERGTGGPLANHPVRAMLQVDGAAIWEAELSTDDTGAVFVSAALPPSLQSSDGLLTVFVDDGGVTESISRSVPILLADVRLAFFPEGGDLVHGLPGRVYFEGKDKFGEPADVKGVIEDDRGRRVASFDSAHDGLGRFSFTPQSGRSYVARVTSPVGIDASFTLPAAVSSGCALRSYDDVNSAAKAIRVGVRCSFPTDVIVTAVLREQVLDSATVSAGPDEDAVVFLDPPVDMAHAQGAVRVTVFDADLAPLAERLVYRNRGRDLRIDVKPDKERYGPRDEVVLDVVTRDPAGKPVAAEVALSVVDDGVVSLANDEEGHMLTRLYLEPELVESPKDPGWYFDPDEKDGARGLDLVMGTKGWRRFEWQPVFAPPVPVVTDVARSRGDWDVVDDDVLMMEFDVVEELAAERGPMLRMPRFARAAEPVAMAAPPRAEPAPDAPVKAVPMGGAEQPIDGLDRQKALEKKLDVKDRWGAGRAAAPGARREMMADEWMVEDLAGIGYLRADLGGRRVGGWAPVRVFPKPDYEAGFTGTRTDFRDTVLWEPKVTTDGGGKAQVRFYLSDAVTSFRVTAEGLGGAYAGHAETTLSSVLPVHVETTLPAYVSAGDKLWVPVTVRNARDQALDVRVAGVFDSELVTVRGGDGTLKVAADGGATHWIPVEIGQGAGTATVRLSAEGGNVRDSIEQTLSVVAPGFPRAFSAAGEMKGQTDLVMRLDDVVPGSLKATVTWHPSTVSTLLTGMEGLIQTPGGCFEQTSSTNWPNVQILSYLEAHEGDPRLRLQSAQALDAGYQKLTGYQVQAGGFETWGSGPGKEALSAFGLLQFADMANVYDVAPAVLERDAKYLLSQRDGRGGFKNSGESAHGYGSAPKPVLDGFITMALVQTGHAKGLNAEIEHQAEVGRTSKDPYVLALAARTLQASEHAGAKTAMERLVAVQAADGSFPGAESSITRSYEANLVVESTALAALALMESGRYRPQADKAVSWLVENRRGVGTWGATQATALALSALTTHAEVRRRPKAPGEILVEVNGAVVGMLRYGADETNPLVVDGWEYALRTGDNTIVLRQPSGEALPYTVDVSWNALEPLSAPGAELALTTALDRSIAKMGDTVRLTAKVANQTDAVVPSPIARIGLPAGLEAQTWQLKQLQDRGEIAFFETRPREVTLYWDGVHAGDAHQVVLDLVARVPGEYTGPASSAYPYYDDDEMAWAGGLEVRVDRP